jgi:hypothetical protein
MKRFTDIKAGIIKEYNELNIPTVSLDDLIFLYEERYKLEKQKRKLEQDEINKINEKLKSIAKSYANMYVVGSAGSGYRQSSWILDKAFWNDNGIWIDTELWND